MFYPVIVIIVKMNITIRKHTKMESYPKRYNYQLCVLLFLNNCIVFNYDCFGKQ